jgi:peptide deformylase
VETTTQPTSKILQYPHEALTTKCDLLDLDTDLCEILRIIKQLKDELNLCGENAMGLAANQIGILKRIFVMRMNDLGIIKTFINPKIITAYGMNNAYQEGCLSSPDIHDMVQLRSTTIKLEWYDTDGNRTVKSFTGIEAICIQHEIDHLNGIFWFDRLPRQARRNAQRLWKNLFLQHVLKLQRNQ